MTDFEVFSRVVSRVHAVPGGASSWELVLGDLARYLGATAATMTVGTGTRRELLATTINTEAALAYADYYAPMDFVARAFEAGPIGHVGDGWELCQTHRRTEFFNDWQNRYAMTDGLFVRLNAPVPTSLVISAPPNSQPFATAERVRFLNALIPHVEHALRTQDVGDIATTRLGERADLVAATEITCHAVIVLGPGGVALGMNTAAERLLAAGDGVRSCSNTIAATSARAEDALEAAIVRALGGAAAGSLRMGSHLVCPRASGRRPLVIRVIPLDIGADPDQARAAVVVIDPEDQPCLPASLLRELFDLTPAECAVALQLLEGHSLRVVADDLAVSVATIKTHVQRIFRKTATHRQTELMRLLLSLEL